MRTKPCAMILLLTMAGCAGPMGPLRPDAAHPAAVTAFDGTYRTSIREGIHSESVTVMSWCQTPAEVIATVARGNLTYAVPHPNVPGNPTPVFQASFAADGSFSGQVNEGTLSGRVTGTHLQGRIDGSACSYTISGDRM